ncbi:glycosyltransferase [Candidatus Poribacteria bacterium]|nr:glycosyltransferase [Candidatus Poribacteria bacterium]
MHLGDKFFILTNTPFVLCHAHSLGAQWLGYDLIDDFCAFDWSPREGRALEDSLIASLDFAFAGTHALFDSYSPRIPGLEYLGSGVDYEKLTAKTGEPADLRPLRHPRLLYVGTLNDRLSGDLIDRVARKLPECSVVLVGPRRAAFRAPRFPPNVYELGLKPHGQLAGYYQHSDLGIMPFADNEAARAIEPVKALEYLACGLPVLSTPIPDIANHYQGVVEAEKPADWPAAIRRLLAVQSDALTAKRRAFAKARSWESLILGVEKRLEAIEAGSLA